MRTVLTSIFTLSIILIQAQTPCVNGMAGLYPCERIDLQYFMPLSEMDDAPGLNDIWGWVDPIDNKEYALVGMLDGTAFIDITDPLSPIYLGELPTHSSASTWRDIKVYNDHAFIVSEASGHGLQVFDLTRLRNVINPPELFDEDAHYNGFSNCHNIAINEESGYAYPIGTNQASGGPLFINIQDPMNPTLEGSYGDLFYSHDAQIVSYNGPDPDHQGKEIYFGFHGNSAEGLVIVDITDKTDPESLSTSGYDCQDYTHQGWVTPDHRYCFVNDELDEGQFGYNTRTRLFNIEDLDNPVLIGNYEADVTSTDHNLYTLDGRAYMSNYTSGLRVVDYSLLDNEIMEEVAFFDVHPSDNNAGYSGTWSNYPYFPSGNIVVTHRTDGLFIVKAQDLSEIVPSQAINTDICPAELSVNELETMSFNIAPNPTRDFITLTAEKDIKQIDIIDITGRIIHSELLNLYAGSAIRINLDVLEQGAYLVAINKDFRNTRRLIIE
ncbi:MAG: choice-of-anchor B family protein [Flavobacteriales bacterium]|nr:choice-of-anchor B family protein [Flavobacteriales bacterium]